MNNWIQKSVFYHIYPLGFCGCPKVNDYSKPVNRIKKLIDWIPHMNKLGVNAVYLGPVFESSEHGYDTRDYFTIDRRLGTNEDFKEVCDKLHEAGIRVVIDGVFNHVGREFWAFRDIQEKRWDSPFCDWFMNLHFNGNSPYNDGFSYESWNGCYNLVKLNLRNPQVADMIIEAIYSWMDNYHIDGLRLDAADVMDKDFFKRLRSACKQKDPDFWLMGEVIHGNYKMWINDEMLDSTTNYECYKGLYSSHNDKNYFEIAHSLNRQFANGGIYSGIRLYNFVDNHDVNRLASTLRKNEHLKNVYTLLFTMPGIPSIYYGSEWGIKGAKQGIDDSPMRPNLSIDDIEWNDLSDHIARLAKLKQILTPLDHLNFENVCIRNEQLVFKRTFENQVVFTACNLSDQPYTCSIPCSETLIDGLTNQSFSSCNGSVQIELPPNSSMVLSNTLEAENEPVRQEKAAVVIPAKPQYTYIESILSVDGNEQYHLYINEQGEKRISKQKL